MAKYQQQITQHPNDGYKPLGEQGGDEYSAQKFRREQLRADLCELVSRRCYAHSAKITEDILDNYDVVPKRRLGKTPQAQVEEP